MPIYEYRCDACGHELEALQKISDARLTACPACESDSLRRLISKPSFRLKGSGWYETDFKSDKEKKRNLVAGNDDKPKSGGDKPAAKESKADGGETQSSGGKKDSGTAAA
jgi:putative FmdB family regulatory protein